MVILKPEGEWKKPNPINKINLGFGYSIAITNCFELSERMEGFIIVSENEWTLFKENQPVKKFTKSDGAEPKEIFDEMISDLTELNAEKMREEFYLRQPSTKREATARRAKEIWNSGNALTFIEETAGNFHIGDSVGIALMILSYASIRVENSEGINVNISGDTGTGKSHLVEAVISVIPEDASIDARLSDKALYHHPIPAGTVIVLDDQHLSEDLSEAFKNTTTNKGKPSKYLTVVKNEPKVLTLPTNCVFWICKANITGDEQVQNRTISYWADSSPEQRRGVQNSILDKAANPQRVEAETINEEICRAIFEFVPKKTVVIPFAKRIKFDDSMDFRTINMMLDLIRSHCLMNASMRVCDEFGQITAEERDFFAVSDLLAPLFANEKGSQRMKLSSGAAKVLDYLKEQPSGNIAMSDIKRVTGMSDSALSYALNGRVERGADGLFAVCPAVEMISQTVSQPDFSDADMRKSVTRKMIRWSKDTYEIWIARLLSGFWLEKN